MPALHVLNPPRIARSVVTVLLLTLIQTVAVPVLSPLTQAERANAAPVSVPYASNTAGLSIVVPAGVFSVTLTARGAAGGKGGNDASAGLASTNVGSVTGTFAVTPGDRISIFPGGVGGGGTDNAKNSGGGTAGTTSVYVSGGVLAPTFKFNSATTTSLIANGGTGGNAGSGGTSGGGGGGGAATFIAINDNVALVAGGGGGGGGGSGPGAQPWNGTHVANGTNATGANGLYGGDCGNTDGGGSGGGGGGWYGGAAGAVDRPGGTGECRAFSGSAGGNFLSNTASSTSNGYISANGAGEGTYDFIYSATSSCTTDQQTSDIYTIIKVTATADCTWTVPATVNVVDLFLVGGGGGGAGDGGPGGGGGATLSRTAIAVSPSSTMRLKVGHGGAPGAWAITGSNSRGDSTTVVTSTGSVFYALGGTKSDGGPSATVTGNQTVQSGSFDGGIGGIAAATGNTVGGVGKPGVSNYFYGVQNTYAGGGGGGCYFSSTYTTSVASASGTHGGGSGCSYDVTTKNSNGSNGIAGTGGGGGGGGAGDALRTAGGKGGSGVILIRYATNADDSFPVSLASSMQQRWSATDFQYLDSTRRGWMDSSGSNGSTRVLSGSTAQIVDAPATNGNSKTFKTLQGATTDRITLADLPTNYTLFHVARYNNGTKGRVISTSSGNWLSGFHNGSTGISHHNWWMTPESGVISDSNKWLLSSDQLKTYRANGKDVTYNYDATPNGQYWVNYVSTSSGFGINNSAYNDNSDWQVADVIVFNRQLSNGETRAMERYLTRVYGLTLDPVSSSGETDTALSLDGNQYFYTQLYFGNTINDTFTIEAWVNPSSECGAGGGVRCTIFSKEYAVRATIYDGKFGFIMYGTNSVWEWNDTNLKIPINEWHHIAFVKRGVANSNGAVEVYLDGHLVYVKAGSPYLLSTANVTFDSTNILRQNDDQWIYVGAALGSYDRFRGQLDELKLWKVARTTSQIRQDMHSSDASSPSLQLYYDFNKSVGSKTENVSNLGYGGGSRADLITVGSATYVDVKTTTTNAAYTTIKFPRTYITQNGGWKVPQGISQVQTLLLGGGGGGGGGYEGGGGGAGGFIETLTTLNSGSIYSIKVGTGGEGAINPDPAVSGETTTAFGLAAIGGGGGASEFNVSNVNVQYPPQIGGSGGGGSWSVNMTGAAGTTGQGFSGGSSSRLEVGNGACASNQYAGAGGGGAGGSGFAPSCTNGGNGGAGRTSTVLGTVVAGGGGGSSRNAAGVGYGGNNVAGSGGNSSTTSDAWVDYSNGAKSGVANTGGGGGAGLSASGVYGYGAFGGSGIVALRYITALKPTYTKPTTAYLNEGMSETFTTNVAVDSATVGLTRTFKWESTTPTANGAYTLLKTGTGASNAAYSWVPSDTSTSGSGYLYRLTVTDSDTAGLFITDSSTAFAVINRALVVTSSASSNSLAKKINIARNETFTITLGTPTYRASLSPVIPGITIDTSTAGSVILKISDTATVGTWSETLTVTDSVSASIVIPLTIVVAAPPHLLSTSGIVSNGLVLNLEAGNSESLLYAETTTVTNSIWRDLSGNGKNAQTSGTFDSSRTCTAPTYSPYNSGSLGFNGSTDCFWSPYIGYQMEKSFTLEAWFKLNGSTLNLGSSIISQNYSSGNINFVLGDMLGNRTITVAFYDGTWRQCATGFTPTNGVWNHIVGTYNGSNMILYVNGQQFCTVVHSGGLSSSISTQGTWIGRRHDGGSAYYVNGSIATARVYRLPLSATEVLANYNATKDRFTAANMNATIPAKKYGDSIQESFTTTSGYETRTVTLSTGNRSGIVWDTATVANQVNLSIQESLTVGSYYDTVTVTDSLGQSTYLPIKMSVTKADSLTVSMGTATSVSYNGSPITIYPRTTISGLKSSDTATSAVRFSSSLYSESTVIPTNADTYTVRGAEPVFTIGLLSNYQGVIYETRTAVVRKINQRPLNIFKYGGTVGSSFVISLQGGDGTGAVTETLTGVSSLTGCSISNHKLSATEQKQGFCEVRVVKAGDQNYFAETETAQLYFMAFVNNQPTGQVGSGATIALNGVTSFDTSTVSPPSITGLSTLTISRSAGGTFTITGTGFAGSISVKFWRNKVIVTSSGNGTSIDIPVSDISNVGATSGRIAVITANGEAVSLDSLTITP